MVVIEPGDGRIKSGGNVADGGDAGVAPVCRGSEKGLSTIAAIDRDAC